MTRQIRVGGVPIGGGAPVTIQSMTNTRTDDVSATAEQIKRLAAAGCEIVRVAVPDLAAARAVGAIRERSPIPLVADIHFDYRLALECVAAGCDKVRINPGNIGGEDRVKAVADACRQKGIPIRIGVNGGSLEKPILAKYGGVTPEALVESAFGHIRLLEKFDFTDICVSLKSSSVRTTMAAYRLMNQESDYPLHLGVTETGTLRMGTLKSAVGIGGLLAMGIGDTMRVSLSADPVEEVYAARDILKAAGVRKEGPELVSCPTCGRTRIDLIGLATQVEERLKAVDKPITVAVMGCVVNGPGEASAADVGIAGKDILLEYRPDVYELLDLKMGKCRMCVAGPVNFYDDPNKTLRVATKFPHIAGDYYESRSRDIDIIKLNGSIELAPILGLSDVIVDIVETGNTLRENHLAPLETIVDISARFICNKVSYKFKYQEILAMRDALAKNL